MPSKAISIRFTDGEHQQLRELAKKHGQPVGAYVRARLFAAVHADERTVVHDELRRVEKALTALLVLSVETVDFQREGFPQPMVEGVQRRSKARAAEIIKNLLG